MTIINTANVFKPAVISANAEERLLQALEVIHSITATYKTDKEGDGAETLPAFDKCAPVDSLRRRITGRAHVALGMLEATRKEERIAHLRSGVREVIAPYITAHRKDREEFDSLSPSLKAKLGPFADTVMVPVSDFASVFPQGTTEGAMVGLLKELGYTIGKSGKDAFVVRITVPVKTDKVAA